MPMIPSTPKKNAPLNSCQLFDRQLLAGIAGRFAAIPAKKI